MDEARHGEIRQAVAERQARDTQILQKVNATYREAFRERFPGQVEHCMRLVAERLQQGLNKNADVQLSDTAVRDLATALLSLHEIHITLQV